MKKFIFIFLLFAGFAMNSEAQVLSYSIYNASLDTWNLTLEDGGSSPAVSENGITPSTSRFGTIGSNSFTISPNNASFAFPLTWAAESVNGCEAANVEFGPLAQTTIPTSCPGVSITYKIEEYAPLMYVLKMQFN